VQVDIESNLSWSKAKDRSLDFLSFFVVYVLPIAGLFPAFWPLLHTHDPEIQQLNGAIISLVIYQIIFLTVIFGSIWHARRADSKLAHGNDLLAGYAASDSVFRELADQRSAFNQRAFDAVFKGENPNIELLDRHVDDFLDHICDATNKIVSLRKGRSASSTSVNIKRFDKKDGRSIYYVVSSSRTYLDKRMKAHENRGRDFYVEENSCFQELADSDGDPFLCNAMTDYILKNQSDIYPEPNNAALEFYNKCIIVPIMPHKSIKRNSHYKGSKKNITFDGVIVIDSKSDDISFDSDFDVSIMREMAINIYAVWHQRYLLVKASKIE
jgi:hypothetical protein